MIEVIRKKDGIVVRGHAEYAPMGKDIVCAGVSALVQTLVLSLQQLTDDRIDYRMESGRAIIKFWCLSDVSKALINAFFIGIEQIAKDYPANVKLTEHLSHKTAWFEVRSRLASPKTVRKTSACFKNAERTDT